MKDGYILKLDFAHLMGWPSDWARKPEYRAKAMKLKIQNRLSKPLSVVAERRTEQIRNRC